MSSLPLSASVAWHDPASPYQITVDPRLINPWLINGGVFPFSGDSDHFWREHPPNHGTGLLIRGQHYRMGRLSGFLLLRVCRFLVAFTGP